MFLVFNRKQLLWVFIIVILLLGLLKTTLDFPRPANSPLIISLTENEVLNLVSHIFHLRNQAILENNLQGLASLHDRSTRHGIWAYELQVKKMNCLHQWCDKQGAKLTVIKSLVKLRRVQCHQRIRLTLLVSTEYHYAYSGETTINLMRIGSYHSLDLANKDGIWVIGREWYADPFADDLAIKKDRTPEDQNFIISQQPRDFSGLDPRRLKAAAYADEYCGAAANDETGFKYNPRYKNYNYSGGDCANFASQVLHEGGGFRKTSGWNYGRGASRAWVNAHAFNRYMLNSGRASRIAYGTYGQVLKASYQLLPGDYLAYEKSGKVTHISVVTGADSKGYALTNSHNVDRYRVPWDLGYGDRGIRFWLVRVHY